MPKALREFRDEYSKQCANYTDGMIDSNADFNKILFGMRQALEEWDKTHAKCTDIRLAAHSRDPAIARPQGDELKKSVEKEKLKIKELQELMKKVKSHIDKLSTSVRLIDDLLKFGWSSVNM